MTTKNKQELIAQIVSLLNEVIDAEEKEIKPAPEAAAPIEYKEQIKHSVAKVSYFL